MKIQVWRGLVSYLTCLRLDSAVGIDDETLRGLWPMALAWAASNRVVCAPLQGFKWALSSRTDSGASGGQSAEERWEERPSRPLWRWQRIQLGDRREGKDGRQRR